MGISTVKSGYPKKQGRCAQHTVPITTGSKPGCRGRVGFPLPGMKRYQKNWRRVSKMFGSSLTLAPAAELNFELLTAT